MKKSAFKYNLPKGYLSYSAMTLWIKNPSAYRLRYYENVKDDETVYLSFGKKIADILEKRDFSEYPALAKIPKYRESEWAFDFEIEKGLRVIGRLDLFTSKSCSIGEVKTGIVSKTNGPPWNQLKVERHDQLPFYSLAVKSVKGKVNPLMRLIWVETRFKTEMEQIGSRTLETDSRELELTGKVKVFRRKIWEWERTRMKKLIIKCAREITNDYNEYLKETKNAK